ncbi:MAG: hypothetical protein E7055_13415 [Lentisphaerae bacterium]|nr:hypothetical protein [Lentisphaerota bacterium]
MKNLTAAIFLTLLFCTVSASGEETAAGFNQNPEYSIPSPEPAKPADEAAKQPEKTDAEVFRNEPDKKDRPPDKNQTGYAAGKPKKSSPQNQAYRNQSYRGSLCEDELKDWERRNSPVPQSLPHATFPLQRQSFTTSGRSRNFRSSSPRISRVRISSSCGKTTSCGQKTTKVTCSSCR